jgi:hypothetical protein
MNYNGNMFRGRSSSDNGEVSAMTEFHCGQTATLLTGTCSGGDIASGQLLGVVNADDSLDFHYYHLNTEGVLMAGKCHSTPTLGEDGLLVMHEQWQWLTGDRSSGESEVEEISPKEIAPS